jgi:hypothetical protein
MGKLLRIFFAMMLIGMISFSLPLSVFSQHLSTGDRSQGYSQSNNRRHLSKNQKQRMRIEKNRQTQIGKERKKNERLHRKSIRKQARELNKYGRKKNNYQKNIRKAPRIKHNAKRAKRR